MKKILISTIAIVMAISMVFVFNDTSSAESTSGECGENLTWTYDPDTTTLTISGEGTAIQDYASAGSPWHDLNVTNVVFDCPNLTTIGAYAFEDSNMSNHKLPYKITTINEGAFRNCYMLSLEQLPIKLTTIGNGAFEHCIRLSIVTIPYGVTTLGPNVFKDCMGIHVMIIPSSITSIDDMAFDGTTGLTTVGNLSTVDISGKFPYHTNDLTVLFTNTKYNVNYTIFSNNWAYDSGNGGNDGFVFSTESQSPGGSIKSDITTLIINLPNITEIGGNIAANYTSLTKVYHSPEIITKIGNGSFRGCSNLEYFEFPDKVTSIGLHTFRNCSSLDISELPDTITEMGQYAFAQCRNLTITKLPDNLNSLGTYVFQGCTGLSTITIPEKVTNVENGVFQNCTNLQTVYLNATHMLLGSGISSYSGSLFTGCTNLTEIIIGEDVEYLSHRVFGGIPQPITIIYNAKNCQDIASDISPFHSSQVQTIEFGDKVEHIPAYLLNLSDKTVLESVSFNDGLKSIGDYAFQNCTNMVVLSIPESVESIGTSAFAGCSNVMIRSLPEGVHLDPTAFQNCTGITSLVLPGEIGFGPNCFEGCTNLKQILNLSDMEIVAGSDNHGKVAKYADSVQDHIDGVAIVQDKEHVQHETVVDDSLTSKLLRFVPVFVSLGLLLGAIAYMYVRRNDY